MIKRLTGQILAKFLPSTGLADKVIVVKACWSSTCGAMALSNSDEWVIINLTDEAVALLVAAHDGIKKHTGAVSASGSNDLPASSKEEVGERQEDPSGSASKEQSLDATDTYEQLSTSGISALVQALYEKDPEEVRQCFEQYLHQSFFLYLTDTGGQLEFQELLPALIAGPVLFFVVFRLDQDLDHTVPIQYRYTQDHYSASYESSFTVRDSLLRFFG